MKLPKVVFNYFKYVKKLFKCVMSGVIQQKIIYLGNFRIGEKN